MFLIDDLEIWLLGKLVNFNQHYYTHKKFMKLAYYYNFSGKYKNFINLQKNELKKIFI